MACVGSRFEKRHCSRHIPFIVSLGTCLVRRCQIGGTSRCRNLWRNILQLIRLLERRFVWRIRSCRRAGCTVRQNDHQPQQTLPSAHILLHFFFNSLRTAQLFVRVIMCSKAKFYTTLHFLAMQRIGKRHYPSRDIPKSANSSSLRYRLDRPIPSFCAAALRSPPASLIALAISSASRRRN